MTNIEALTQPGGPEHNAELTIEQQEVEGLSQGQIVRRRFVRHTGAMVSLAVFVLIVLLVFTSVGIVLPYPSFANGEFAIATIQIHGWWPYTWNEISPVVNNGNPTMTGLFSWGPHPFGQDEVGRDIFARVMRGTQQSLTVMVLYGGIAAVLGIVVGGIAGFFGGWVDNVLMRVTDLFLVIPVLVFAAVLGQFASQSPFLAAYGAVALGLLLGFVGWMSMARLVRGEFLALREREFVDAARVAGASSGRIIFRHILPNALGVVIVATTLIMATAIVLEASLSFIGFGIQAPDVSLGQIVNEYQGAFVTRPWLFWFPGVFVVAIALCINFIGDGLRDAFDPRQTQKPGGSIFVRMWRSLRGKHPEPVAEGVAGTTAIRTNDADGDEPKGRI
ncbi:ABC transporter permease [Pseudoclavibacter chungangensis]|uniref:Oligopeptide transport system permease protein OppC n=1 Tax=Pseudoclavibacter chungangensis TaxID=587635 RepID=A0A7J5BPE3_9MICO|nr:ABC transporter permease [Pseudoclavibacter chungangensis]KAB1652498.1 ABC transporter permease [Pseudoclavibacter chungangensis]NYJ66088.1 peptide/nickel transport system permease protein [Pseudoclavibacter chungangensis]